MKRNGRAKLTIRRETLRKLAAGDLAQAAGGRNNFCTYRLSGCQGHPETDNCPPMSEESKDCDTNCCQ